MRMTSSTPAGVDEGAGVYNECRNMSPFIRSLFFLGFNIAFIPSLSWCYTLDYLFFYQYFQLHTSFTFGYNRKSFHYQQAMLAIALKSESMV